MCLERLKKVNDKFVIVCGLCLALFQIYTAAYQVFPAMLQRSVHLGFGLALIFMISSRKDYDKSWKNVVSCTFGIVLAVFALIICFDIAFHWTEMESARRLVFPTLSDRIFGVILIVMVILATKRQTGWAMPIIAIVFLLYALLGYYLPIPSLRHNNVAFTKIISMAHNCTEGIFSSPLGVSTEQVYIFLLFGALLEALGGGQFFLKLANGILGKVRGGAAKAAIFACALFGSISGSAVANVVATGTITIPLMKKSGYDSKYAGAIVSVASTGGLIMPPVMGAAAFLMANTVGCSYWEVCIAALIPAVLYYVALFFAVDLHAGAMGLQGLQKNELPTFKDIKKDFWIYVPPLAVLIFILAVLQYPAYRACMDSIILLLVLAMTKKELRQVLKRDWMKILVNTSKSALTVIAACACAGLILLGMQTSGLLTKLSSVIIAIAQGKVLFLLLLVALTSIILGMGLPAAACYILLAITAAPALIQMGVPKMAAHLFVLYFGAISAITPPVAMAAFAAGPIAKTSSTQIGYTAFRLALPAFLIAFCMALQPELCMIGSAGSVLLVIVFCLLGVFAMAVGLEGYLKVALPIWRRVLWSIAGFLLILPGLTTSIPGLVLMVLLVVTDKHLIHREKGKDVLKPVL